MKTQIHSGKLVSSLISLAMFTLPGSAQSLDILAKGLKGKTCWDPQKSTLRFIKDCKINFP